jgi:uncharacterized protein (TIGR02186 family)
VRLRAALALLLTSLALSTPFLAPGRAAALDADLSHHLIAITTAFSGTDVLVFGAIEEPGTDVAVVVRGPLEDETVRRRSRIGPVWLFTDQLTFRSVPGYYAVASSRPLAELAPAATLARHELGVGSIRLRPAPGQDASADQIAQFREALIRNKQREGLYATEVGRVSFLGRALFRTRLAFPANVPPGSYQVQVLQFRDGAVINAQSSPLGISKIGLEADLFDFAHRQAALYGLAAILLAVSAGWSASVMFRRH